MDSHSLPERWPMLVSAVESLARSRDFEAVRDVLRATARTIANAQGIAIVVREGDQCHYIAEDAISPLWAGRRFDLDSCVSGMAMRSGETIVIPDVYADPRVPDEPYRPTFVKSMVMTPIGGANATAAIGAYWDHVQAPDETTLRLLDTLARSTATALENIQLSQSRRHVEAELLQQTEALEIVNRTGIAVAAERDLDVIVQLITDAGVELTGAQFGAFFYNILDERGESYMLYGLSGVPREAFSEFPMPRNTKMFAPTFTGTGIVRSDDIRTDPRYGHNVPHKGMPEGHLPVASYLAVPVISRSGVVHGGLFFGHELTAQFEFHHEELILGVASHAAIAIDNARLDQDAKREIAARQTIAEHLRESNDRFRAAVDAVQGVLWTNNAAGEMEGGQLGWSALTGQTEAEYSGYGWTAALHPNDIQPTIEAWQAAVAERRLFVFEHRVRGRDGVWRHYAVRAIPIFDAEGQILQWVGVHTDITEQRDYEDAIRDLNATLERRVAQAIAERETMEEALRQAQKMEAVGQLTGGIAHDFNNLLTIIMGNMDMAARNLGDQAPPRVAKALANAQGGAERAATLTQRLLAFARRQPLAPKPTDVGKLIAGMSDLLTRALGETIAIETIFGPGLWQVEVDPNQLESTIINLAVNARDAMNGNGRLIIESQNAVIDRDYALVHSEVAPGPYVVIAVTDSGAGMSVETLARAFDPFFTTKEVGKGTGLGLSQVYGFVKQSGGHVKIYSELGQGTAIKLYLPRLMGTTEVEEEPQPAAVDTGGHSETVLVVEDDEDVRVYAVESLRELGYQVLDAHDGPAALKLLEKRTEPIDLLFTDIVMPGMTGRELAEAARLLQPGLKTLYSSGYTRNAIMHGGRLDQGVEFLAKPFTFATLSQRVREVLDKWQLNRILLVDGDDGRRSAIFEIIRGLGFSGEQASSTRGTIIKLRTSDWCYDAVVADADIANGNLEDFVQELHALRSDLPILLLAGETRFVELEALYADNHCVAVLAKPCSGPDLRDGLTALNVSCSTGDDQRRSQTA